jgi:hypothetical protein
MSGGNYILFNYILTPHAIVAFHHVHHKFEPGNERATIVRTFAFDFDNQVCVPAAAREIII